MWDFLVGKNKNQIDKEYSDAIENTKKSKAEAAYNYYYNKAAYDKNKDYFNRLGIQDPSKSYWNENGQLTNALHEGMGAYNRYLNALSKEREEVARQNKYNKFGNGLLPSLFGLNAMDQYIDAANDLGKGLQNLGANVFKGANIADPFADWNKRDHLSDLGATLETGLALSPFVGTGVGIATKGANLANKTANSLGKSVLKGTGLGAAYGGIGNLGSYLQMAGDKSNLGDAIKSSALGAALGGVTAGGLSAAGYGLNKLAGRAQVTRNLSDMYQQYLNQQRAGAMTDSARLLGDGVGGATSVYAPLKPSGATGQWLANRGNLAKTKLGQAIQGAADTISYKNLIGKGVGSKAKNVASKVANSKVGTNAARILKTKAGKVGAGVGGGLLLSQLLNNKGEQ